MNPSSRLALAAAGATAIAAGILAFAASQRNAEPLAGTPVPRVRAADAALTASDGRPGRMLASGAAITFVFFGYTHCPDACPIALASLGRAYRSLAPPIAARTRIVFVSVDPDRDRPAVVGAYVAHFDPHIIGLTGTAAQLAPVWKAYGIYVSPRGREIDHGDAIYGIDRRGRIVVEYPPNVAATDLAHDAAALARGQD